MKTSTRQQLFWILMPLAIGMLAPSAIILGVEVFVGGVSPIAAITDVLKRQFGGGHNLFLLAPFGLIPFATLSVACFVASCRLSPARLACLSVGGLLGILCVMVPAHVSVWYPLYGGGHMSSTAVLAFLFIPFQCLVPLLIGLMVGWGVSLLPFIENVRTARDQSATISDPHNQ
jgi:hypothetical protein